MKRSVSVLATLVLVALSATACASLPQPTATQSQGATVSPNATASTTPDHSLVPPNATSDGTGVAPFKQKAKGGAAVVELFFDYQCPACANFEQAFGEELGRLAESGDIALVFRPMVFLDINYGNDASTRSAVAATCSDASGKFDAYHNTLFGLIQTGYPDSVLTTTIPGRIGLTGADLATFQECYSGRRTLNFVRTAGQLAIGAGVQSTPTLRVDGKTIDLQTLDASDPASLQRAIEAAR